MDSSHIPGNWGFFRPPTRSHFFPPGILFFTNMASKISEDHRNDDCMDDSEHYSLERQTFLNHSQSRLAEISRVTTFSKIMATVNLVLGVILATSLGLVAHSMTEACPQSVAQVVDPWCQ